MVVVPKKERAYEFLNNGSSFFSRSTTSQKELAALGQPKLVPTSSVDLSGHLQHKRPFGYQKELKGSKNDRKDLNRSRSVPNQHSGEHYLELLDADQVQVPQKKVNCMKANIGNQTGRIPETIYDSISEEDNNLTDSLVYRDRPKRDGTHQALKQQRPESDGSHSE